VPLVVDTVSVDVPAAAPVTAIGFTLNEQAGAGVPPVMLLHERFTLPVYPFAGVTVMVEVDALPAVTEPGLNAVAVSA
jgi:hypothetical protein